MCQQVCNEVVVTCFKNIQKVLVCVCVCVGGGGKLKEEAAKQPIICVKHGKKFYLFFSRQGAL